MHRHPTPPRSVLLPRLLCLSVRPSGGEQGVDLRLRHRWLAGRGDLHVAASRREAHVHLHVVLDAGVDAGDVDRRLAPARPSKLTRPPACTSKRRPHTSPRPAHDAHVAVDVAAARPGRPGSPWRGPAPDSRPCCGRRHGWGRGGETEKQLLGLLLDARAGLAAAAGVEGRGAQRPAPVDRSAMTGEDDIGRAVQVLEVLPLGFRKLAAPPPRASPGRGRASSGVRSRPGPP